MNIKSCSRYVLFLTIVALCLQPMEQSLLVREGSEPDHFWKALGGRSEYSKEKRVKGWPADPHLYACRFEQGMQIFYNVL
jgi:hypothetical protein